MQLAEATARGLRHNGFAVDHSADGEDALYRANLTTYDVIVLDRDLPLVHGDHVCQALVGGESRIIMLTALGGLEDRVAGLNLGADDYLAKPFALSELVARVRALGRRSGRAETPTLTVGDLTLDAGLFRVERGNVEIPLTRREFDVLEALMRAAPAPLSAEALLDRVWDDEIDPMTNIVRVMIASIRRKLGPPDPITTIKGVGYRLDRSAASVSAGS
ncbi:UNVERIFIED_CONTAM: hypothetical protein GTU68_028065 [Idotea baltica]|nr:hypothetical protein [Idotea baltica]